MLSCVLIVYLSLFSVGFQIIFDSQAESKVVIPTEHGLRKILIDKLWVQRGAFQFYGRHGLEFEALRLNANAKSFFVENEFQEKYFTLKMGSIKIF